MPYHTKGSQCRIDEQVRRYADILQKKTREYTGDGTDRLGAFKAAAALQHTTPERALAGMLAKHIISLYDMCFDSDTDYNISTWNENITDSLNCIFKSVLFWTVAGSHRKTIIYI